MKIKKIGIVGSGQMGSGIAQVCASCEFLVQLMDTHKDKLEVARATIEKSAQKLSEKNLITSQQKDHVQKNISYQTDLKSLASCDLVIEAVVENEAIKADVFKQLDTLLGKDAIIASNTSSLPITRLANFTKRPEKFIGMHFMNPVPMMKLVEIIPGMATSGETLNEIKELTLFLGKEIVLSKDYPGFIVNRVLMPMINEAFTALMEGVGSPEDIDKGMKLGTNQPMGPLTLADFIGLDTCLSILRVLHQGLGDPRYRPSPLLVQYVDAGWLGRKTKRGVYIY